MPLRDWQSEFGGRTREAHAARHPSSTRDLTPPAAGVALGVQAVARVNHGRWIADCPWGDGGAEYVDLSDPFFFCCECRNVAVGNQPVKVALPTPSNLKGIDGYLSARPEPLTRNWTSGEKVTDLRDENQARGLILRDAPEGATE